MKKTKTTTKEIRKIFAHKILVKLWCYGPQDAKKIWWDFPSNKRRFVESAIDYLFDKDYIFTNHRHKLQLTEKYIKSRKW